MDRTALAPTSLDLTVWHIRPDGIEGPDPSDGPPDVVHIVAPHRCLLRPHGHLLATTPYVVSLEDLPLADAARGRRRHGSLDPSIRRLLERAAILVVGSPGDLWSLQHVLRSVPPVRVVPADTDDRPSAHEAPEVIDLRDDGTLVGDWGFSQHIGPADHATVIREICHQALTR